VAGSIERDRYMTELPAIWLVVGIDKNNELVRSILSATYSASGLTVTVRQQHSGQVVGRASGGGYDKTHTALAHALTKVYGIPPIDGGSGERHLFDTALGHGVKVRTLTNALWALGVNE
jgi:hypothetical protein